MLNSGGFFCKGDMMLDKLPVVEDDGLITPEVVPGLNTNTVWYGIMPRFSLLQ